MTQERRDNFRIKYMQGKITCHFFEEELKAKTDEQMVSLTLQNKDCFLFLMQRYEAKLLGYIRKISNFSLEEAQDILQETFIKIYQGLNEFDQGLKFSSWIYRITRNQTISHFRKAKARPQVIASMNYDLILEGLKTDFNLENQIDQNFQNQKLLEALGKLDFKHKEVLILHFLEGKDYSEIADILKKPVGTVGSLVNRAKKKLGELIEKN